MRKFYIYAHRYPGTRKVFYIGCGQHYRPWQKALKNRKPNWLEAAKDGFVVKILHEAYTQPEADALEQFEIARHRRLKHPLINKTNGGQGTPGLKREPLSDEVKLRISKKLQGRKVPEAVLAKRAATWALKAKMRICA